MGFIPARFGSTRFPGKPLATIAGRPMVQHVWERARAAKTLEEVVVATDDRRILQAVADFGGRAVMTSKKHATGTDRIAQALEQMGRAGASYGIVVNIQGDEPLIDPRAIDAVVRRLRAEPQADLATAAARVGDGPEVQSPHTVKVAIDRRGRALYFSRSPIPFYRRSLKNGNCYYKHIGLYAYRRQFLRRFVGWRPGWLERAETLEQLRALEQGAAIAVVRWPRDWPAVDTRQDLAKVRAIIQGRRIHRQ